MAERQGVMLAKPLNINRPPNWLGRGLEVFTQPKINGNRCRAVVNLETQDVVLYSSQANAKPHLYHIKRELLDLTNRWMGTSSGRTKASSDHIIQVYDGELYHPDMYVSDIQGICSSTRIEPDSNEHLIQYWIFDTISPFKQFIRLEKLEEVFRYHLKTEHSHIVKVKTSVHRLYNDDFNAYRDLYIEKGFEGIIFRNPGGMYKEGKTSSLIKYKHRHTGVFKIVSMTEEISIEGIEKDSLGAVVCVTEDDRTFKVGSGFTREQRETYWNNPSLLIGMYAEVKYPETTINGLPFQPVISRIRASK